MLSVHVRRNVGVVHTPAKVNLFLEVIARRPDGFHEIETLISPIAIFDTLYFSAQSQGNLRLTCSWASGLTARNRSTHANIWGPLPQIRDNLVWRAVELFRERAGVHEGASIHVTKRIPSEAGLGGASADAAAALVAANAVWRTNWTAAQLCSLAAELGSDIPVLIAGRPCICRGRGEQLESISANRFDLVVVKPPVGLSTAKVYELCEPPRRPSSIAELLDGWTAKSVHRVAANMMNRLQKPAEQLAVEVEHLRSEFKSLGVIGHQMTGSGSSYFGICRHARHARQVAARLRGINIGEVTATTTLSH